MCSAPSLPHVSQHQTSGCLLTQLSWPKSGGEDSWRDDLQPMGSLMRGEQEHYTKNSDLSFLHAPAGSSNLPMRQSPGKTTPRCLGAPHLILHPRDAPGAVQCNFSLTLLYLLHVLPPPTLDIATSHPKSHHVRGSGGWWLTEVIFGLYNRTSSLWWPAPPLPITREKGCFVPGCITSSGQSFPWQKQATSRGHSGLHLTVGTTLKKKVEPRVAVLIEWQEAWAALPAVFLYVMKTLDDTSWNRRN